MNFCPSCGVPVVPDQNFCRNCGYSLQTRLASAQELGGASVPVYGMDARNLYLIYDDGILSLGTRARALALVLLLPVFLAILFASGHPSLSPLALSVAVILVLLPLLDEYRYRRLAGLTRLPREEMMARAKGTLTPWSSLRWVSLKGNTFSFTGPRKSSKAAVDSSDLDSLKATASAALGSNFVVEQEHRTLKAKPLVKFVGLVLALFALTQVLALYAALAPFFPGEQAYYTTLATTVKQGLEGVSLLQEFGAILLNNVQVALASIVPGFGFLTLAFSSYNTGRVLQAIALQQNLPPSLLLFVLYLVPHTWVEEFSYPLSGALGLYALIQWRRISYHDYSNRWKRTRLSIGFGLIASLLALAAVLEVAEPILPLDGIYLWVPLVLGGVYLIFKLRSRFSQIF